MAERLYEGVRCGCVDDVRLILDNATLSKKVDMLKYVIRKSSAFFLFNNKKIPSRDVTDVVLLNIVEIAPAFGEYLIYAFHIAVRYGKYDAVYKLLSTGVDPSSVVCYSGDCVLGWVTPIEMATRARDARMVALLLSHNVPLRNTIDRGPRFWENDPVEVLKLDLSIDGRVSGCDMSRAIFLDRYDRVPFIMAVVKERVIGGRHVGFAIFKKRYDAVNLLHAHFKRCVYFEEANPDTRHHFQRGKNRRAYVFDLPSLREVSMHALRVSMIRDELSMIRSALLDLKTNEGWMDIESNLILYPLIKKVIDSHRN